MIARTIRTILMLCLAAHTAMASAADFEAAIKKQYEKHVVALRHAVVSDTQVFDVDGHLLSADTEGPWNAFGCVRVTMLEIMPDKIMLSGSRFTYRFNDSTGRFVGQNQNNQIVTIEVRLEKPLDSAEEADLVLGKVFAPSGQLAPNSALGFWLARQQVLGPVARVVPGNGALPGNEIFHIGGDVAAPVPVYTPEPEFSDKARQAGVGGTVVLGVIVDNTGKVSKVWVTSPLGMGLDENAADKVRTWRFQPALRQGQPVAVNMKIEVSFNLYQRGKR